MHVALLLTVCCVFVQSYNGFQYITTDYTNTCEMCYSYDCVDINKARCEYYREVTNIMEEDEFEREESEVASEVDAMLWEYVDKASSSPSFQYCIPLVSEYTNCHKDNICSGCKVCNCDVTGKWNCSVIENCHRSHSIIIDHRILVKAMENLNLLNTDHFSRIKRSSNNIYDDINEYNRTLNWLYGIDSLEESSIEIIRNVSSVEKENFASSNIGLNMNTTRSEVKNNNLNKTSSAVAVNNDSRMNKYIHTLKWLYGVNSLDENVAEKGKNWTKLEDVLTNINNTQSKENNTSIKHLEKRSVVLITNESHDTTLNLNTTDDEQYLHDNILEPLNNIIIDKEKEINQLVNIKAQIIKYLKLDSNITDSNNTNKVDENKNSSSFNLYKIEMPPETDFRRRNTNMLEKYIKKLKKDIHEVMRDIAMLQKLSKASPMSYELKILIGAMRNFVQKDKIHKNIEKKKQIESFRRNFNSVYNNNLDYVESVINILEVLDKDIPTGDALAPLSQNSRKILERIIKFVYSIDSFNTVSSVLDPNNEIESYLNDIGSKWDKMTLDVGTTEISERVYSLKIFVLELSKDILKISKVIESLEYVQNRRMNIMNDFIIERLVSKVGIDFKKINNRVEQIIQFQLLNHNTNGKLRKDLKSKNTKKKTRKSFIQQIKKLLRNSKTDIKDIFTRVPESVNVKKRKRDELKNQKLAKFDEIMRKWQKNLGVSRSKRNADFKKRINNIIPKYLRGKVKHGVDKKKNTTKTLKGLRQ